jgi:hypothetical protein
MSSFHTQAEIAPFDRLNRHRGDFLKAWPDCTPWDAGLPFAKEKRVK